MDQKRESPSFMSVIAGARDIPEGIDPIAERDSPSHSPLSRGGGIVNPPDSSDFSQLGAQVNCLQFSEVLLLWKPWEACPVCRDQVAADLSLMPADGTYVCPHTQHRRYKEIIDRCLSGKAVLATKEFFNLKNGARVAHVEWLESDPEHIRRLRREAEEAEDRQVYPPNPEKAFAKAKDKPKK